MHLSTHLSQTSSSDCSSMKVFSAVKSFLVMAILRFAIQIMYFLHLAPFRFWCVLVSWRNFSLADLRQRPKPLSYRSMLTLLNHGRFFRAERAHRPNSVQEVSSKCAIALLCASVSQLRHSGSTTSHEAPAHKISGFPAVQTQWDQNSQSAGSLSRQGFSS